MPVTDVVPEVALLAGSGFVLVVVLFLPRARQALGAGLALGVVAAAAAAMLIRAASGQAVTFAATYAIDGATAWTGLVVLGLTALAVVMTPEWLRGDPRHGEYYAVLLLSALGAIVIAAAADTMVLVVGLLLSSVTGYTLAAYHRRSPLSVEAGIKYFLIGALTNTLLFVGVVILFGLTATTVYGAAATALRLPGGDPLALAVATGLLLVGLGFKLGAVPAHAWVPDVAEGAPAPAAAFLTAVPKIAALVAVARLMSVLPADEVAWRPLVAAVAAATMTLGNLSALSQDDLRRLLGWSAVSQSGYGLMAVVAMGRSSLALPALLYFVLGYGLANLAAFGVVVELRGRTALADYRGLGRQRPVLAAALLISLFSFVGIPPLAGFVGKLVLFAATLEAGYAWLALLAVANTVVSLAYYLRVLGPAYLDGAPAPVPVLGRWAGLAAVVAASAVVVAGLAAEPLLQHLERTLLLPGPAAGHR